MRILHSVWLLLLLCPLLSADESSLAELRAQRKKAAQRERRVIFNNDGNDTSQAQETTPEELLRHRTSPLAGTHVDAIFYCTTTGSFGQFKHDTRIGSVFTSTEGDYSRNLVGPLLAAGVDPLRVMVDFGRANDIEVFCSFRMNDTHDGSPRWHIMYQLNPLKQQHPEWLLGSAENIPQYGRWTGVDYTHAEIRDLMFRYVEEVCQNYDVDGVELDFFRHPVFFKRAAQTGTVCNQQERDLMTDLMRQIRRMTEVEGQRRGRPILVSVRVPDSVEYCRDVGLDLETWLQDGLIDLLAVAGYFQLNDWKRSVELGSRHDVPVYPSLDESRLKDEESKRLRMSVEAYRGRALHAWKSGAGGVYLFNAFKPRAAIWRELGDPQKLARSDHDYFASVRGVASTPGRALSHREYQNVDTLNPDRPLVIDGNTSASVTFPFAADVRPAAGAAPQIRLRLRFDSSVSDTGLKISLNNQQISSPRCDGEWVEFSIPPDRLRAGENRVDVSAPTKAARLKWTDLHCTVRWP